MPQNMSPYNHLQLDGSGALVPFSFATLALLKARTTLQRAHGMVEYVQLTSGEVKPVIFHSTSTLTGDDVMIITPSDAPTAGRWLHLPGTTANLSLAFTVATADAAVLYTVPTGVLLLVGAGFGRPYWEIDVDMAGGTSSAIGASGPTPHNTKGDLLGGSGGDVAATLTAALSPALGTVGADVAAGIRLKAADTIKFDRITSLFTTGNGRIRVPCFVAQNAGA